MASMSWSVAQVIGRQAVVGKPWWDSTHALRYSVDRRVLLHVCNCGS